MLNLRYEAEKEARNQSHHTIAEARSRVHAQENELCAGQIFEGRCIPLMFLKLSQHMPCLLRECYYQ